MGPSTPAALFLVAVLVAARCFAAPVPEISFRMVNGFIAIEGHLEHRPEKLTFLLDSGASVSVLNTQTARRLGLNSGTPQSIRGVVSEAVAYRLKDVRAKSGSVEYGGIPLATDLSAADELCTCPVDGLIGAAFLRDRVVEIDFATQRLRIFTVASPRAGEMRIPLKLQNDVICAAVGVNGSRPRWARLDTGCNEPLHWVVPRIGVNRDVLRDSIGFVSQPDDLAFVSVSLGSRTFYHTEAVLHGRHLFAGESGLLGTGLLSRFSRVTIDWPKRVLYLRE
jgi:hypothetical protein